MINNQNIKNKIKFNDSSIFLKNSDCFEVVYDFFERNDLKINNCVFLDICYKKENPFYVISIIKPTIYLNLSNTFQNFFIYKQMIYQFSHEFIHHYISDYLKLIKWDKIIRKNEEILCSAFALYMIYKSNFFDYLDIQLDSTFSGKTIYSEWSFDIIKCFNKLKINEKYFFDYFKLAIK